MDDAAVELQVCLPFSAARLLGLTNDDSVGGNVQGFPSAHFGFDKPPRFGI